MKSLHWFSFALFAFALAAGAMWALQRQSAAALQQEIALLKDENRALARLRAENQRLQAGRIPMEELQHLQADRAALQRLRSEIEALKARTEQRARETVASPPAATLSPASAAPPPALALKIGVGVDGALSMDGHPIDLGQLRQRFASLAKGAQIEIRVRPDRDKGGRMNDVDRGTESIMGLAKELGLKITMMFDRPGS